MTELTGRIAQLRDENERFLRAAARATQETLATASTGPATATYDATGRTGHVDSARASGGHLFDGRL
jgi:flagellar biosynthesis/type III secretory pathway chaperone